MNNPKVDLRNCKSQLCKCGSELWTQALVLKEVPGLLLMRSAPGVTQVGVIICAKCKEIHPDHIKQIRPEKLSSKSEIKSSQS